MEALLVKLGERERAVRVRIDHLHGSGFNLSDLRTRFDELHTRRVESIHSFARARLEAAAENARRPLGELERELDRFEEQARQRRAYGGKVLALLGVLLASLVWYKRTNR